VASTSADLYAKYDPAVLEGPLLTTRKKSCELKSGLGLPEARRAAARRRLPRTA